MSRDLLDASSSGDTKVWVVVLGACFVALIAAVAVCAGAKTTGDTKDSPNGEQKQTQPAELDTATERQWPPKKEGESDSPEHQFTSNGAALQKNIPRMGSTTEDQTGFSDTVTSDTSQPQHTTGAAIRAGENTVEDTIKTLKQVCRDMDGGIQPQCTLHEATIRAGMHAAVAEVTNKFRTQVTAVFFPEPPRMDKHMRMYQKPGIRDFMPIISEQRNAQVYRDSLGRSVQLPGFFFVDRCQTLREAMAQCRTQRDFLHELFTVCQHLTRQLVIMHRRKLVLRDICLRNVVRTNLGQVRSWTFLEYAGAVRCGTRTESMPVRTTPPALAKGRLEGKPMIVQYSYDMWQLGVFVYELSTGEPYWSPKMTDGQVLHVLSTPQMRLPHESRPVSIDLVNRILKQLLTRDESTRLDSVALKALLDHEEETGTLSSTMNSTMNPTPQPNVVLEGIGQGP